jgi:hypothetical protein
MLARSLSTHLSRALVCALAVTAVCMTWPGTASAQTYNKRTTVTFSAPVEIPGVGAQVLPAGTYVFKLLDMISDRHVVQIFNKEENHVYATILAIPNYRLKATSKTVMTFAERAAGEPQAIRAWFYPGDNWGQEFVYPRKRAVAIAAETHTPVLYMPDEVAPNIVAAATTANDPPVLALKEAPVKAVAPTGVDVDVAQVVQPPPAQAPAHLPKTAGEMPLVALMGVLCLGIGLSLRRTLCAR